MLRQHRVHTVSVHLRRERSSAWVDGASPTGATELLPTPLGSHVAAASGSSPGRVTVASSGSASGARSKRPAASVTTAVPAM